MDTQILTVLVILALTVILLILEVFRIDLVAILCMLALGWTGILNPAETLSGFGSNAVIAMIAVMIMGTGIAHTGVMNRFSGAILRLAGGRRSRLLAMISLSAGLISAFMQNVGAAALFLPAVLNISRRERIPASELIMPLGFAAILGGTLTMVASSPLILLNDLLRNADLKPYGLFGVTPVGLILLGSGVLFFLFFGRRVLPRRPAGEAKISEQMRLIDTWHLPHRICRYGIPTGSRLVGKTTEESGIWERFGLHILAVSTESGIQYAPWRHTGFEAGQELALLGDEQDIQRFADEFDLKFREALESFRDLTDPDSAGFSEILIPSESSLVGRTMRELSFRKKYAVEPLLFFSRDEEISGDFSDRKIRSGDTLVVHGLWDNLDRLKGDRDFVVVTPIEGSLKVRGKTPIALLCFAGAIGLTMARLPISISLFSGAVAMMVTGVIRIDEAYRAVEWKVVFLIAGLIPLGIAMQKTGTASFLATRVMGVVQGQHPLMILLAVALMSTVFSLFMSNVASTVVLAPLVISIARMAALDPRPLVLLVAVCAANSFLLPTHQVNAMLMTPGGYRNRDYFRAGGGMTLLFVTVVVLLFYLMYI